METLGIDWGALLINVLIFGSWPFFSIIALLALRRSHITGTAQALWALLVIAIPILGTLAFFLVKPGENNQT